MNDRRSLWTRAHRGRSAGSAGRSTVLLAATALLSVAAVAPAVAAPVSIATGKDRLGGHQARATATPLSVLLFEERVRITTSPEGEADLGYTDVTSASGPTGRAVASVLWPGPLVGDGLALLTGGAGLPPTAYPVSAKSTYPTGGTTEGDLGPAVRQSASTSGDVMVARVGIDQRPEEPAEQPEQSGKSTRAGRDGSAGGALAAAVPSAAQVRDVDAAADEPDPMSALYAVDSVASRSQVTHSDVEIRTESVSRVDGVALLAGLIRADSIATRLTTTSDGAKATARGATEVVGLEVQGTPVAVGDRGVRVAGQGNDTPDSRDLRQQLDDLGIGIQLVDVKRTVKGATGSAVGSGLIVDVDTTVLRSQIDTGPLDGVIQGLPPEVATNLQLALTLSPRLVLRLGYASSATAGSPVAEVPELPTAEAPEADEDTGGDTAAGGDSSGSGSATSLGGSPSSDVAGSLPPPTAGVDSSAGEPEAGNAVELAGAPGLPPLYGGPGALLLVGLMLASAAGVLFHRFGAAALGAGRPCVHGNELGIPDLRKV